MDITAFDLAERFVGLHEVPGVASNPQVLAMLRLDDPSIADDETPWCSAFANYIAWLLRLPRSKSLAARSWLSVGIPIGLPHARPDFDVVVLSRPSAGPTAGHVGFFAGSDPEVVWLLGGNQGDAVSVADFPVSRVLGVRRLL
jgi:uncharacterized protein (TIGR02594 family)